MSSLQHKILQASDGVQLGALDQAAFAEPWTQAALADELTHADARVIGLLQGQTLIAAVLLRLVGDAWWVLRVMVHPVHQRHGLARKLFCVAAQELAGDPREMWLEVAVNNAPALALYRALGFETVRTRKNYYPGNIDALEMRRSPSAHPVFDYVLLDSGAGQKWERFGCNTVIRPMKEAIWQPAAPMATWKADAVAIDAGRGAVRWEKGPYFVEPWGIQYGPIVAELHAEQSRNVGIFPEQASNWKWLNETIAQQPKPLSVLNLFAYTGMASWVCAQAGAAVTHVDAAKSTVQWASKNGDVSKCTGSIRWIVEDAARYVEREIKRGHRYDAVILDPPPLGRANGKSFVFDEHVGHLLQLCKAVLTPKPAFVLLNCYALHHTPLQAKALLQQVFPKDAIEAGELRITEQARGKSVVCSVYARFARATKTAARA